MAPSPDRLASWARQQGGGWRRRPAINVVEIAHNLGVKYVLPDYQEGTVGRLEMDDGGATIYYRPEHNISRGVLSNRQRFTVAHELSHYLLARNHGLLLERQVGDPELERYCDRFAASLLLPKDWIRGWSGLQPSIGGIEQVSRDAGVSISAAVIALESWAQWDVCLLHWKLHTGKWRIGNRVLPEELRRLISSSSNTRKLLDGLGKGRHELDRLPLKCGRSEIIVPAEVVKGERSVMGLIPKSVLRQEVATVVSDQDG